MRKLCKAFIVVVSLFITFFFLNIYKETQVIKAEDTYEQRVREYRAAWVSHFAGDISRYKDEASYKASVTTILDNMQAMNMNAIVFHVRTHNNAFYKSTLNPKASYYSDVDFNQFDPLEWIIEECHKRGMEFHAWMNPYRVSTAGKNPDYTYEELPSGNAANDPDNLLTVNNSIILDPGRPAVRQFIVDTCMELIENYDVDAIHFDDYFYISGCDDSATRAIYNTNNLSIDNFRREQVNLLIKALHDNILRYNLENNKAVEIGIAPSGVYRNGSYSSGTTPQYDSNGTLTSPLYSNTSGFAHYGNYLYSDTKYWIDNEWIDYITPQSYHAIKQKSSSFTNLTEWWSWCVKYKKVNLSMGIGIYMVLESGSSGQNWQDEDELYNQMINANGYDEIHGLCFYKYSSMLSSNTLMQGHVNTLKNFWSKYVPCPVKPQYTNLPEPIVKNVTLDGNTLSWDAIDDVRGYVVWKVGASQAIDMDNIDQLYKYVPNNEVTIDNEVGYKYYVSSVNLANEFSIPTTYNSEDLVNQVINLINTITFPITIDEKNLINSIDNLLDELTQEQKDEVINLDLFNEAKRMYAEIETIAVVGKELEETLPKDVEKAYLLPLSYGDYKVSWEYADDASRGLYDISTGNKLVEYLGTTFANLKYTLSNGGVSYSNTIKLNVGYTKTNEVALFYRNTPHALNAEEDPTSTGSFIGWSGKVLKFNMDGVDYVFYIAAGNYHELTNSTIPENQWSSCGDFYLNKSGSTISAAASEFDVSTSNNYGYFIINASGKVRKAVKTATSSEIITLNNNEGVYLVKYLDGLINDSVMKPADKLADLNVTLLTPNISKDLTSSERVTLVNNEISNISYPITLLQKEHIIRARSLRQSLTDDEKNQLNNVKLDDAYQQLLVLMDGESDLLQYKEQKKNEISNYISDLSQYNNDKVTLIQNTVAAYCIQIDNTDDTTTIDSLVLDAKSRLDQIPTKADEDSALIVDARLNAITEINEYITDLTKYSETSQNLINQTINNYVSSINNSQICDEVESLKNECIEILRNIPTMLDEAINNAIDNINAYMNNLDLTLYDQSDQATIRASVQTAKTKIRKAQSVEAVNSIYNNLINDIENIDTIAIKNEKLNRAKSEIIDNINNHLDRKYYQDKELSQIDEIIERYTNLVNNSLTESEARNHESNAISELDQVECDMLLPTKNEFINKAEDYLSKHTFTDFNKANLLVKQFKRDVKTLATEQAIQEAYYDLENELSVLIKKTTPSNPQNASCNFGLIVPIMAVLGLSLILIKRKH